MQTSSCETAYICLDALRPINFHVFRPGTHAIVSAAGHAMAGRYPRIQIAPLPHARVAAVRANNPLRLHGSFVQVDPVIRDSDDGSSPKQIDAAIFSFGDQYFMQTRPADPNSLPVWKICRRLGVAIQESYASKLKARSAGKLHAQERQSCLRLWHQAFAARFIDGRLRPVRDSHRKTFAPGCNRRRQSRRSSPNYKNIRCAPLVCTHSTFRGRLYQLAFMALSAACQMFTARRATTLNKNNRRTLCRHISQKMRSCLAGMPLGLTN